MCLVVSAGDQFFPGRLSSRADAKDPKRTRSYSQNAAADDYLDTAGEFNHLLGLAVLQTIDTGNTVSNGQDTTGLLDINGRVVAADALLKNGGDLRGG